MIVGLFFWPLPQSSGVILFEVCMLCFIVTFHVTTFDKGNRLVADKTHRFCAPHRQHKCILVSPLFLKFAIFGINFSLFAGFKARHDFRLLRKKYRSQIYLPALLPLTHTTCVTHRARGQWVSCHSDVVILQLLIGPLDWTRKIETTSSRKKIYHIITHQWNLAWSWLN